MPDGDTGTNMFLTMQSAYSEISESSETSAGKIAHMISQGALMGARGNSGVILSQLLRGFARLHLLPGERKSICFNLPVNVLAYYGEGLRLVLEPGTVKILIGSSSEDIRLQATFEVTGETKKIVKDRVFDCPVTIPL